MSGFNSIASKDTQAQYFTIQKGLNSVASEPINEAYFSIMKGFAGIAGTVEQIQVKSVSVVDLIGNVSTFSITNASLEDVGDGGTESKILTFNPNTWTANETDFMFGLFREDIRLNFDISGLSASGNPFNLFRS